MRFATKPIQHYPPHHRHVATLLEKLKIQIFCRYSAIIPILEENANKLQFKCTCFNSPTCVTVYAECIYVFYQNLVLFSEYHVDC